MISERHTELIRSEVTSHRKRPSSAQKEHLRQLLHHWGLRRWLLHPRLSLHASSSLFTPRVFEASCGSPLSRLSSTHGSRAAVTSRYCNIKARRQACACRRKHVELCEDVRLPEPAALRATSTIKAASEYRSIFPPVKCGSFPPYAPSNQHLMCYIKLQPECWRSWVSWVFMIWAHDMNNALHRLLSTSVF